jgi:hypothetical protein
MSDKERKAYLKKDDKRIRDAERRVQRIESMFISLLFLCFCLRGWRV